ncbi:hypothetical protein B7463_g10982, partial [Scytalidium lignicola]
MQNILVEVDSVTEHRRLQNRLSQRKFRRKTPGLYTLLAANNRPEKKALEQKLAQATFELVSSDTVPSQGGCNSNDAQPLQDDLFYPNSSIGSRNDIERDRPEGTLWEAPQQNSPRQPESICSPPSSCVRNDMGMYMDLEMFGERDLSGVGGIAADLNNSNPTSTLQYCLLPLEPNAAKATWPDVELENFGDSSYFRQWAPIAGASSVISSLPTASIKSSCQPQYQSEAPSPTSQSSTASRSSTATTPELLPPLLHVSAQIGNHRVLQSLLKHGATVNERDSHGRTALHVASEYGHDVIVSLLLAHGADCEVLDRDGKSALYLAVTASHIEVVDTLLKHQQKK